MISPGDPFPEVTWFRNSKKIKPKKNDVKYMTEIKPEAQLLVIKDLVPEDGGDYVVKLSNPHGTAKAMALLTVTKPEVVEASQNGEVTKEKVEVEMLSDNTKAKAGEKICLTCRVKGT